MQISAHEITEILVSAAIFIALWAVLGRYIFRPFIGLLEEREARTSGDEKRAQQTVVKGKEVLHQIEQELKEARLEGIRIRDSFAAQARSEGKKIFEEAFQRSRTELEAARDEMRALSEEARKNLVTEAEHIADAFRAKVLPAAQEDKVLH